MSDLKLNRHAKYARSLKKFSAAAVLATTLVGYGIYRQSATASPIVSIPAATYSRTTTLLNSAVQASATPNLLPTSTPEGQYKDGEYTGDSYSAERWGNVQAKAIIKDGKLSDIQIIDYPYHRSVSNQISHIALPMLMDEAIKAQSASVDMISGATFTSEAFIASLQSALDNASTGVATSSPSL